LINKGNEKSFRNDSEIINVGNLDESKCFQFCNDDLKCLGIKLKNGNCYTTTFFDPFTDETCLSNEKCFSVASTIIAFLNDFYILLFFNLQILQTRLYYKI
jgi:hypothetical protein